MAIEIERKFLVVGNFPKEKSSSIIQAYLSLDPERIVRIRIESGIASITFKGVAKGISNIEFEYPIPEEDAQELLKLSIGKPIKKTRYRCLYSAHTWEIDVYKGANQGLIVAEIELDNEKEEFERPDWIGKEVSEDPKYRDALLVENPYTKWKVT